MILADFDRPRIPLPVIPKKSPLWGCWGYEIMVAGILDNGGYTAPMGRSLRNARHLSPAILEKIRQQIAGGVL